MSEITKVAEPNNPFAKAAPDHLSAGAVAIESERAIAEAQGRLLVAKRFPRDEAAAFARVMDACRRPSLAEVANYRFPRGGQSVEGPSIRLAEELARCWGNIAYGMRELSRRNGESEMEAFAWDQQTNVLSTQTFTVRHLRDKRGGSEALKDERDIYEITANMASRRLRARILAVLPPDLVDAAVAQCRETVKHGSDKPMADRIREMTQAFVKIGVSAAMLAEKLGKPLDTATPDDLADLRGIYQAIRDGATSINDAFGKAASPGLTPGMSRLDALEQEVGTPRKVPVPGPGPLMAVHDNATPEELARLAGDEA
ncbi:MAG TPA: hypothetical protein VGN96_02405 [Roseococcus sp.]|jgi:hypothetical protein|nr:hypothetical protein [Roseococcus sp.]